MGFQRVAKIEDLWSGEMMGLEVNGERVLLVNVDNRIYAYADRVPGKPMDAKVLEFLRFILSQEGQAEVMRDGKYLPLTADVANGQLKKLEAAAK